MQLLLLALVPLALAAPLLQRDSPAPTAASAASLDTYVAPARFSRDAYCSNLAVGSKVGDDGQVLWLTGDGRKTQRVYVAHSPSRGIVVAHQVRSAAMLDDARTDDDARAPTPPRSSRCSTTATSSATRAMRGSTSSAATPASRAASRTPGSTRPTPCWRRCARHCSPTLAAACS